MPLVIHGEYSFKDNLVFKRYLASEWGLFIVKIMTVSLNDGSQFSHFSSTLMLSQNEMFKTVNHKQSLNKSFRPILWTSIFKFLLLIKCLDEETYFWPKHIDVKTKKLTNPIASDEFGPIRTSLVCWCRSGEEKKRLLLLCWQKCITKHFVKQVSMLKREIQLANFTIAKITYLSNKFVQRIKAKRN